MDYFDYCGLEWMASILGSAHAPGCVYSDSTHSPAHGPPACDGVRAVGETMETQYGPAVGSQRVNECVQEKGLMCTSESGARQYNRRRSSCRPMSLYRPGNISKMCGSCVSVSIRVALPPCNTTIWTRVPPPLLIVIVKARRTSTWRHRCHLVIFAASYSFLLPLAHVAGHHHHVLRMC